MKINTTRVYPYSAESYGYTLVKSADGTVVETKYNTVPTIIKMELTVNLFGELEIKSKSKLQLNSYLKNVLDKNGDQIYESGEWQVIATAPLLTNIGVKDGYQYRAQLIVGNV